MKRKLLFAMLCIVSVLGLRAQGWTAQTPDDGDFYLYNVGTGKYLSCGSEYWGTKACIDNGALKFTLANDGSEAYTLYTTSTFSYGNPNTAQLQSSGYVDQSVSATKWTFTPVDGSDNTYTLLNAAGTYLCAPSDGTKSIVLSETTPTDTYGYWKLVNDENLFPETASIENPVDITCLIGDANFESCNDNMESFWTIVASNNNLVKAAGRSSTPNNVVESWQSTFTLTQTINVPNGWYRLRAQTCIREYTETGTDYPVVYITSGTYEESSPFIKMVTETAALGTVEGYFTNGDNGTDYFTSWTDAIKVTNGSITIGAKGTRTNTWCIFDNFQLQYVGPIDLTEYADALADAVGAARATEGTVPTVCYDEIASVVMEKNQTYSSEEDYTNAIVAINTAVSTYASSAIVAAYSDYLAVRAAVLAINSDIDVSAADALANAGTNETYATACTNASTSARSALSNYIQNNEVENVDLTAAVLVNPSFEDDFTGWTNNGMATQTNASFEKVGNVYCEKWVPNGTFGVSQTITALTSGVYRISAKSKARSVTSAKLYAGGVDKAITVGDTSETYSVEFATDANAEITFGFEGIGTGAGSSWLCVDNFTLTYVGALPDVTAVTGKMNAEVSTTQTTAIETYAANKTVANYNAAVSAINAAQISKEAYAVANLAITKANAIKTNHTFASSSAVSTFTSAIAAISDKYEDGTLTDANATAAGTTLGTVVTGWHGNNNAAAVAYLRDGFSLGDFAADPALHVNTWSTEGDNDGSGFSVPFYESWTADANSLPESTITGTLTTLPNGLYSISAWVRVRAKNETAATDATGITMDVNGGGEGDYAAVDVTEGEQVGSTQFQIGTYTAKGLVKDGSLTLNFNIADNANISWLSFQKVSYTKVRDLTAEEMAVAPTAIALYNGEDEVTEPIALDATTTTVTLTPSYTPAGASEGYITWTTSDASVATIVDGVVTAISTGTATITATSTLAPAVSASATINVTFPESEVAGYVNDGATRTVYNYGPNIIKNGSFEYADNFYGWTSGTRAKMTSSNFSIETSGAYDGSNYLKAKADKGQADAGSIYTSWPVEAGKKYVFSYQMKNSSAVSDDGYIRTSLSATTSEDETNYNEMFGAVSCGTNWTNVAYEFTVPEGKNYLVFSARWLKSSKSFDNFYLCEVLSDPTTEGNVDYATAAIPTANIGTGAFQYSQDAIDAANALVQGTATVENVEDAYDALTTLNAPASDAAFNIVMGELTWTNNNNATMLSTVGKAVTYYAGGRNDAGGYTAQFDKEPNTNLAQAFYFTAAEGKNKYTIYQIDADGAKRYLCTGTVYGGNANQVRTTTEAASAEVYTITATATEGVYNLTNTSSINLGAQDAGLYGTTRNNNLKLVATSKPSITINTTAAGWGTVILPFAVAELPEGVKAYTCAEVDVNGSTLTLAEVTALEANKPYIIEGAWNETLTGDAQGTALTYTEGLLTGVYASTTAIADTYVLQNNDGKVGFYRVDEGEEPTIGANRAYLTKSGAGVKAFFFNNTDAIKSVFDGVAAGDIYDLAGRKVSRMQKGNAYIVNGKKVVIK